MTRKVMKRTASDNEYLHKHFHYALSCALDYMGENYGEHAVVDYLRDFASSFYAPLKDQLEKKGIEAIKEHYQNVFEREGGVAEFDLAGDELVMSVRKCPAISYMREDGLPVSPYWRLTVEVINEAICKGTDYRFELLEYDPETGKRLLKFYRRPE